MNYRTINEMEPDNISWSRAVCKLTDYPSKNQLRFSLKMIKT